MNTRTGKIAQLPKSVRDDLNHRLQNGKQGPELLQWLNSLPETRQLITTQFDGHPINRQNLTEWRQGGHQDWLQHQQREWRIQRLIEEGADLAQLENQQDAFEHSARFALAELMADFDTLHKLAGDDRVERLRKLTRELVRLQNAFNGSRWSALAWTRWNERFLGPSNYDRDLKVAEKDAPTPHLPASQNTSNSPQIKPIQTNSTAGGPPASSRLAAPQNHEEQTIPRPIVRRPSQHKNCRCLCKHCHPHDSEYPYEYALADQNGSQRLGTTKIQRGQTAVYLRPVECNCPCPEHASASSTVVTHEPDDVQPSPAAATLSIQPPATLPAPASPNSARDARTPTESLPIPSAIPAPQPNNSSMSPVDPLVYNSIGATLKRISELEAKSQKAA